MQQTPLFDEGPSRSRARDEAPSRPRPERPSLAVARDAGKADSERVHAKAMRQDSEFMTKAQTAILAHLRASPGRKANSEDLVDVARAHGALPHDDRAFGQVFRSLQRQGLILTVGFAMRRKGKGAPGARIWALQ